MFCIIAMQIIASRVTPGQPYIHPFSEKISEPSFAKPQNHQTDKSTKGEYAWN